MSLAVLSIVLAGVALAAPVEIQINSRVVLNPAFTDESSKNSFGIAYYQPNQGAENIIIDVKGVPYFISSNKDKTGALVSLETGKPFIESEVLRGLSRRNLIEDGKNWLVAVDYWPSGGSVTGGIYRLQPNGEYQELKLAEIYNGLADLIRTPEGILFADFEADNIWSWKGGSEFEQPLLGNNPLPMGIYSLLWQPEEQVLYVANRSGNWPFDGKAGIYRVENGKAMPVADLEQASALAWSHGKLFPKGIYFTNPQAGSIEYLKPDGTRHKIIEGLKQPYELAFEPETGVLWVIDNYPGSQIVLRFSARSDKRPDFMRPVVPGQTWIHGEALPDLVVQLNERYAITNKSGKVRFDQVDAGEYLVAVEHSGLVLYRKRHRIESGKKLEIGLELLDSGKVSGRIRQANGDPVVGADILLVSASPVLPPQQFRFASDLDGTFSIESLPFGEYRLKVSRAGYRPYQQLWKIDKDTPIDIILSGLQQAPPRKVKSREPDNEPEQAVAMNPGQVFEGTILPKGDADWIKFNLHRPGQVTIMSAHEELQRHVILFAAGKDGKFKQIKAAGVYAGNELKLLAWVQPEDYRIKIEEWGNNSSSVQPYTLALNFIPDDGIEDVEPADFPPKGVLRRLKLASTQGSTIWPMGDHDLFLVDVPGAGRLNVKGLAPHELHVRLFSKQGKLLKEAGVYTSKALTLSQSFDNANSVYLRVSEWGDNQASVSPYSISVDWLPADPNDLKTRNDRLPDATPAREGITVTGNILPRGDRDLYRVPVDWPGQLVVHAEPLDGEQLVRILDDQGEVVAEQGAYSQRALDLSTSLTPGTWFVEIREWGDNAEILSPYFLHIDFLRAEPEESLPLAEDNPRDLAPEIGRSFRIDVIGDKDSFRFSPRQAGKWYINLVAPVQMHMRAYRKGQDKPLLEKGWYAPVRISEAIELEAHDEIILQLEEWGNNSRADDPGFILISRKPLRRLAADDIKIEPGVAPGEVVLSRISGKLPRPLEVALDMDLDGKIDIRLPAKDVVAWRYPEAGLYQAIVIHTNMDAQVMNDGIWPKKGSAWNGADNYSWRGTQQHLTLDFGKQVFIAGLKLQVDNNDAYQISYSADGKIFRPVCKISADMGKVGSGTDRFSSWKGDPDYDPALVVPRVRARYLRVTALSGDDRYSVAEMQALGVQGQPIAATVEGERYRLKQQIWVDARDAADQREMQLALGGLPENEPVEQPLPIVAFVKPSVGANIRDVRFLLDGKPLETLYSAPFETDLPWGKLDDKEHLLEVVARDSRGQKNSLKRTFRLGAYFGLQPADHAELTGQTVRIGWSGNSPGDAKVRYRKVGDRNWRIAWGASGRQRSVLLRRLDPGFAYEYQIVDEREKTPVRQFKLLKGLSFGQSRYGVNVQRDYDQRLGIFVRNNGSEPLKVKLKSGKPVNSLLLVGFVGEGSEDKPIMLQPGEERQFLLGISAQDVLTARHQFPVYIESESGLTDEALIDVWVRLPRIELSWRDLGKDKDGIGHLFELINKGDAVTDLSIEADNKDKVSLSPSTKHGLLKPGQRIKVHAWPALEPDTREVTTRLVASAMNKRFEQTYSFRLAKDEKVYGVWMVPGLDTDSEYYADLENTLKNNAIKAAALNPEELDWSAGQYPQDLDQDGQLDRWELKRGDVLWLGDDTNADGVVDFVHADVGEDGIFDYSAFYKDEKWRQTNLMEAWLEMGFSLPWSRNSYHEHSVDIVFNGQGIGSIRDQIPEGNYSFIIPPQLIKFNANGLPEGNKIGIQTSHLRGGHYVVNSDFRFKFRMTATPMLAVGRTPAEARLRLKGYAQVSNTGMDISISSANVRVEGSEKPKAGDPMMAVVPLRNLGSMAASRVEVVINRTLPDGSKQALGRTTVLQPRLDGITEARISFNAPGGENSLEIVVDPNKKLDEFDRSNNFARYVLKAEGDSTPPVVTISRPRPKAMLKGSLHQMVFQVVEDQQLGQVSVAIDGGLWQELDLSTTRYELPLLLQPGLRELRIRAVDLSGNQTDETVSVQVDTPLPKVAVQSPKPGERINRASVDIRLLTEEPLLLVAARIDQGTWHKATLINAGKTWTVRLPVSGGEHEIDIMAVNQVGTIHVEQIPVQGQMVTSSPLGKAEKAIADQGIIWLGKNLDLQIDLFQQQNGLLERLKTGKDQRVERLVREAEYRQGSGDYLGAMNKYRESLLLKPDPVIEDRFKRLEYYLNISLMSAGG